MAQHFNHPSRLTQGKLKVNIPNQRLLEAAYESPSAPIVKARQGASARLKLHLQGPSSQPIGCGTLNKDENDVDGDNLE
jgi:hypothetical protein